MTKNKIYKKILHFILYMRLLLIIPLLIIIIGIASLNISFFLNNSLQNYSLTTAFTNKVPNPTEYSIQNDTTPIPQEILAYVAEFQNQATIGQYNQTKIFLVS